MRWRRGESRQDIEDLRGQGAAWVRLGGGRVRLGCGGILVLLVLSLLFKRNLFTLLDL